LLLNVLAHELAAQARGAELDVEGIFAAVAAVHQRCQGAYAVVALIAGYGLLAFRDPHGVRPLVYGSHMTDDGPEFLVASESVALDTLGFSLVRDINAGEALFIDFGGSLYTRQCSETPSRLPCIFEYVYFARPDSNVFGRNVYGVRKRLGEELAKEQPVEADLVIPVPDSGVTAAIGYAQQAGIPLELGLIRNHYVGRTFIEPKQSIRDFGVKIKLNPNADLLRGKRIIVVDDSIVRGTTSRKLVQMLRDAGTREVHMRISAPPTIAPCYYGIDTPERGELIASHKSVEEIARFIGVDSLGYLSMEGLYRAVQATTGHFCDACFSDTYPIGTAARHPGRQEALFEQPPAR